VRSVPGPWKWRAWKRFSFKKATLAWSARLWASQAATGSSGSTRVAWKMACQSLCTASSSGRPGKTALAQPGWAKGTMVQLVTNSVMAERAGL
jgi:hypothetical protein